MAFLQDIKGALPSLRGPRYTVTLMGGEAAAIEHRGKPLTITASKVAVAVKGAVIEVSGSGLAVTESGDGQLFVVGKISGIEVLE